jgi:hypothetical protein
MIDGNTWALNNYERQKEKEYKAFEGFLNDIEDDLKELEMVKERIMELANSYEGFDFEDDAMTEIKERLNL